LVKKYSEFINYPISLYVSRDERVEVPESYPEPESKLKMTKYDENGEEITIENDDMEILSEDESEATTEDGEVKMKTITQQKWEWEILNEIKAIWLRPKGEITDREYKDFYRTISKDPEDPLAWTHFSAEGEIEFKAILYVPRTVPSEIFNEYYSKSSSIKLYVRRVLITEEFEDLMPRYLTFIRGVVDSDDLPLNVSRE
jgi:heat shock protein beta